MTIIPTPKSAKIRLLLEYIHEEINSANRDLTDEANPDVEGRLDDTYVAGRDSAAKGHLANIVKAIRWVIEDLSLPTPTAFTDAEIDALNVTGIRVSDDGL